MRTGKCRNFTRTLFTACNGQRLAVISWVREMFSYYQRPQQHEHLIPGVGAPDHVHVMAGGWWLHDAPCDM